jgi:NADH-dependent peroxiredoxin subunit F
MYDLIVLGGGPAGMTAMMYAIRKRLNVLMVSQDLGGKSNYHLTLPWMDHYHLIRGLVIVDKFRNELEYLDFARQMSKIEKISARDDGGFDVTTEGGIVSGMAVIVATGARMERLNVPGEKEFLMRGLGYSAISYAPLFIDRTTVVVGDGDLALRSAAELALIAKQVNLVCSAANLEKPLGRKLAQAKNVKMLTGCRVLAIKGDEYARSLLLEDATGQTIELEADATFVEKDLIPNSEMVAGLVDLDDAGRIEIDCSNHCSHPGIFAAGDVTSCHAEQVLVAVGEGAKAALSAYEYLLPIL